MLYGDSTKIEWGNISLLGSRDSSCEPHPYVSWLVMTHKARDMKGQTIVLEKLHVEPHKTHLVYELFETVNHKSQNLQPVRC